MLDSSSTSLLLKVISKVIVDDVFVVDALGYALDQQNSTADEQRGKVATRRISITKIMGNLC